MKLSQLTHWILHRKAKRLTNQRLQSFHFERLEPRTVLSVSLGSMPPDIEAHSTAADAPWERIAPVVIVQGTISSNSYAVIFQPQAIFQPQMDYRAGYGIEGSLRGSQQQQLQTAQSHTSYGLPQRLQNGQSIVVVLPPGALAMNSWPPGRGPAANSQSGGASNVPEPQRFTNPALASQTEQPTTEFNQVPLPFAGYGATTTTATSARTTSVISTQAYDTAFENLRSDRLLLATSLESLAGSSDDDGLDRFFDESTDDNGLLTDPFGESLGMSDEMASLEVIRREREAIEQVLADLQDVTPRTVVRHEDTTSATLPMDRTPTIDGTELPPTSDAATAAAATDAHDGGMVWLMPTGDANSSAFILTNTFVSGLPAAARPVAGLEASVGLYQAFDMGESMPAPTAASQTPATPAAKPQASASAERDSAAKTEQPT